MVILNRTSTVKEFFRPMYADIVDYETMMIYFDGSSGSYDNRGCKSYPEVQRMVKVVLSTFSVNQMKLRNVKINY